MVEAEQGAGQARGDSLYTWQEAILLAVRALGGRTTLRELYARVEDFYNVNESQRRPSTYYPKYQAYFEEMKIFVYDLVEHGDLARVTRGVFELTPQGRRRMSTLPPTSRISGQTL
jgi:hypothetical protein